MEAFSDGVIAILITVMVLELPVPHGTTWAALRAGPADLPDELCLPRHLLEQPPPHAASHDQGSGLILWANLHLLFWLSLIPFTTEWLGENHFAATPAAAYGIVLLAAALAYYGLQTAIIRDQGSRSVVAAAVGRDVKGKLSPLLYVAGIGLSFVSRWPAVAIYAGVAADVDDPRPAPGTHHHRHSRHQPGPGRRIAVIVWCLHPHLRHGSDALSRRSAPLNDLPLQSPIPRITCDSAQDPAFARGRYFCALPTGKCAVMSNIRFQNKGVLARLPARHLLCRFRLYVPQLHRRLSSFPGWPTM